MEIAKQFGIEPTLLLAQVVNFVIILVVLKKFFYKPIVKTLEDRKAKIEQSLQNADLIEQKLDATEQQSKKAIEEAMQQAKTIIDDAKAEAQRLNDQALEDARKTQEESAIASQAQIESQKEQMRKELEKETLQLVAEVTKKVLGRTLNKKEKEELTTAAANQIGRQVH